MAIRPFVYPEAKPISNLGRELARLSDSATWALYLELKPGTKVGFVHNPDGRILLTLLSPENRGVVRYADNAQELIEVAHDALFREGEIEVI